MTSASIENDADGRDRRVFISHSSRNSGDAVQIANSLEASGIRCWIAPRDIPAGSDYSAAIMEGFASSRALVFVCSRDSVESGPVTREVERAVSRGLTVIPVGLETAQLSPSLEFLISTFHWINAFPPPVDRHLEAITAAVIQRLENR